MKIYNWNPDKNQELMIGRGVSFEEAIFHIGHGGLLDDIAHPNASDFIPINGFLSSVSKNTFTSFRMWKAKMKCF